MTRCIARATAAVIFAARCLKNGKFFSKRGIIKRRFLFFVCAELMGGKEDFIEKVNYFTLSLLENREIIHGHQIRVFDDLY